MRAPEDTEASKLPSFKAMSEFAVKDERVKETIAAERKERAEKPLHGARLIHVRQEHLRRFLNAVRPAERPDHALLFKRVRLLLHLSTHKHTPEGPRFRLVVPLSRNVSPDEYAAVARKVAEDIGMELFDDTTYEPSRLMRETPRTKSPSPPPPPFHRFSILELPVETKTFIHTYPHSPQSISFSHHSRTP